ncbi:YIP1 family protein [Lysinibacillus sp. 54212]|uniref:YIP1 family protein n=1 Tax=Lysinibacillus sp. 54212 TaxID=3119829 RepID=UPI002FC7DAF7
MNPLISVWLHPKQTARYVIEHKSIAYSLLLISLGFIGSIASSLTDSNLYPNLSAGTIVIATIIFSPIIGIIGAFIFAGITYLMGRLLKGTGSFFDVFKALSLGYIPYILIIPLYLGWMVMDPDSYFYLYSDFNIGLILLSAMISLIPAVFTIVINIAGVAEAHHFSNWRAFFSVILPAVVLIILLFVALLVFTVFFIAVVGTF